MGKPTKVKKIFLVNPSDKDLLESAGDRPPIGLLNIEAKLHGKHDVRIYDLNHLEDERFYNDCLMERPDVVGVSVYTSPLEPAARQIARRLNHTTHLIAGGYHATALPHTLTDVFDTVVVGEGEEIFEEAMTRKGVVAGKPAKLDELAQLNYDVLDMNKYGISQAGRRAGTIISSRGCPYECSFCGKMDQKIRFEPAKKVKEQIAMLKDKGFNSLYFVDDVFTANAKRLEEVLKDIDVPFRATTRANLATPYRIGLLSNAGCETISLGIESGDNRILNKANKRLTTEDNRQAVITANQFGINTKGFFIIGLPGETEETAQNTIKFARELKDLGMTQADFYFLTPFPGTPIWNDPSRFGIKIRDMDYTKYLQAGKNAKCLVDTEGLSSERIEELVREAKENFK